LGAAFYQQSIDASFRKLFQRIGKIHPAIQGLFAVYHRNVFNSTRGEQKTGTCSAVLEVLLGD
jgi:hypothetical protein